MGYFAGARDLRNLLAVATMLRRLAEDALHRGDAKLYCVTAEALEKRAGQMAAGLPPGVLDDPANLHKSVNLII